jgi:hypothetical protein
MENHQSQRQPPAVMLLQWWALCVGMWGWAIIGPLFVVLGALSFFLDLG